MFRRLLPVRPTPERCVEAYPQPSRFGVIAAEQIRQRLHKLVAWGPNSINKDWRKLLATAFNHMGKILQSQGRLQEALAEYKNGARYGYTETTPSLGAYNAFYR